MMPFNLNESIKVKLTDLGYQRLADNHNAYICSIPNWEYRTADYYKQQADAEGYTKFQMWGFMKEFGEVTRLGGPNYFNLTILIPANVENATV